MNSIISIKNILGLCLQPRKNFESVGKTSPFSEALGLFFATAMAVTVALLITGLFNQDKIAQANIAMRNTMVGGANPMVTMLHEMAPWTHLLFPIVGFIYVMTAGFIRHLFISLLGEEDKSLMKTQVIHLRSAVPAMILLGIAGLLSNLFPVVVSPGHMFNLATGLGFILTLLAGVWEAVMVYKGFRVVYKQNPGRAILSYLSLPVMGGILLFLLVMLLSFGLVMSR